MYGLTNKQKLAFILEKVEEMKLTAYDIGKKTKLSITGIDKILNGTSKNPQEKTLNTIIDYLESKVLGTNLHSNSTQVVNKPSANYETDDLRALVNCQQQIIDLTKRLADLKQLLRDNELKFDE